MKLRTLLFFVFMCSLNGAVLANSARDEEGDYLRAIKAESLQDYASALEYYERAAANGVRGANFSLGRLYRDVFFDDFNSYAYFLKAAETGDHFAQIELGLMSMTGNLAVQENYSDAKKWFETAISQDMSGQAAYYLARLSESEEKVLEYLNHAINLGHSEAALMLGGAYREGKFGLSKDLVESERLNQLSQSLQE